MWVKPWLSRRVTLGHYDNLMQELMRESRGDFKSDLRIEPDMHRVYNYIYSPHAAHGHHTIRRPYGALSTRTETVSSSYGLRTGVVRLFTRNFSQAPYGVLR